MGVAFIAMLSTTDARPSHACPRVPTFTGNCATISRHSCCASSIWCRSSPRHSVCTKPWTAQASRTRDAKRRGLGGLPGLAHIGWSNRLGCYEGFHLLLAVAPVGVITGFGFGPASTQDQRLADTLFALRRSPQPQWRRAGAPAQGPYVGDKGFAGVAAHTAWAQQYGARVICPPKRHSTRPWSKRLRRWLAGIRQMVETV